MKTGQRFGSALAEMGVLTVEQIKGWIQRQLTLITFPILNYRACRFYFFDALDKDVVPEVAIPVPLGGLLLDIVRRAGDLPLEELAADADLRVMPSQDPLLRYQAVELNEHERKLLACVTQAVSAEELLAQSGLPGEAATRALLCAARFGRSCQRRTRAGRAGGGASSPAAQRSREFAAPTARAPSRSCGRAGRISGGASAAFARRHTI